jgi:hypothetical protein
MCLIADSTMAELWEDSMKVDTGNTCTNQKKYINTLEEEMKNSERLWLLGLCKRSPIYSKIPLSK